MEKLDDNHSTTMKKLRIALVALHFAEYTFNLAIALAKECDVLLVLYRDNAANELGNQWQEKDYPQSLLILIIDRPRIPLSILKNAKQMVMAIKSFGPDVIHYQEEPRDELILSLPFLSRIPSVLTVHDPVSHSGADTEQQRFSRLRFLRGLLRRSTDMAITHGAFLCDMLATATPRFAGKIQSVPHGPLGVAVDVCSDASIHPAKYCLLFFGRIEKYKGLKYFIDAVTALNAKGYPVTGVVAGKGSDLAQHRLHMENSGYFEILDQYVPAAEVPKLFSDSFAVVLPYTDGTQSGVAAMALGFGRPVIASAVGSIPEMIRHGKNGLLVKPADAVALTEAIESLIKNKPLWSDLVLGAQRLRDGELSWDAIAQKTICVYGLAIRSTS